MLLGAFCLRKFRILLALEKVFSPSFYILSFDYLSGICFLSGICLLLVELYLSTGDIFNLTPKFKYTGYGY